MVKHLRKHNTGRRKNRIHFANIQFPYKLLGPDLEELGEEIRKLTQGILCVVIDPAPGLTSQPLSTPCSLPLFLTPQKLSVPSPAPRKSASQKDGNLCPCILGLGPGLSPPGTCRLPQAISLAQASPCPGLSSMKIKLSNCIPFLCGALQCVQGKYPGNWVKLHWGQSWVLCSHLRSPEGESRR